MGRFGTQKGSKLGQKCAFPKVIVVDLASSNKCFLARFEPLLTWFGPWKVPKCLENGPFWDPKGVTIGSKPHFSKSDPQTIWDAQTSVFCPFGACGDAVWPMESPKTPCKWAVLGPNGRQKWVPKAFFKIDPLTIWDTRTSVFSPFEPVLTWFGPWKVPECLASGPTLRRW